MCVCVGKLKRKEKGDGVVCPYLSLIFHYDIPFFSIFSAGFFLILFFFFFNDYPKRICILQRKKIELVWKKKDKKV